MKTTMTMSTLLEPDKRPTMSGIQTFQRRALSAILVFAVVGCVCQGLANAQAKAQVRSANGLTVLDAQHTQVEAVDYVKAKAMPLPNSTLPPDSIQATVRALLAGPVQGPSGGSEGGKGDGITRPAFLGTPAPQLGVAPEDFGTSNHPFTTVRADLYHNGAAFATNALAPYAPAGKLFFNVPGGSAWCSASLIKPGIVVTAAHCVANFGQRQFYSGWQFVPGYRNGSAPYGVWNGVQAWILTSYFIGTDPCAQSGVICQDDVALIVLSGTPGHSAGWYGYWYGGGSTPNGLFQITQLGYPVGLDNGLYMERTDSYGYTNSSLSNNTIIGSNMNAGSSGGPWLENFGLTSTLTGETNGSFPQRRVIVGVTGWGYVNLAVKEQGASPFTFGNIQVLINAACGANPLNCQ
jgi:V8-like Glu-specific endopeptidase